MNNIYYDQIMALPGLEEMKEILLQWDRAANNISRMPTDTPIVLPDLLWSTRSGAGKTHLIKLLTEYLYSKRLMDFYGDIRYFEFLLEYCQPNMPLTELTRLIREVNCAAGFRSEYRGVLALDITLWNGHFEELYFHRILEYLSSVDDYICVIFIAENFSDEDMQKIENILSSFFRIRRVSLLYPSVIQLADYLEHKLSTYGLKLEEKARELLSESIDELKENKYFDGYKTINRMCQDIVFDLCSSKDFSPLNITVEKLSRYSKNGEFVKSMKEIIKTRKMGFGGNL